MTRTLISRLVRSRAGRRSTHLAFVVAALSLAIPARGVWCQEVAQSRLQQPAGLDARNAQGITPLIAAASAGQADTVRSLLAQGAGINATSADGRTALIAAVQGNQMQVVQALIAAGADLNRASRGTGTALNVAENTGKPQIAALLLASGALSTGKSVGDTVCVRPWGGDGFCGTVNSFSIPSVEIQVTKIVGCANGCPAKKECSASKQVGGADGLQAGDQITVPSWCLTQTGVKP
jgi:ankyrin repeat protein